MMQGKNERTTGDPVRCIRLLSGNPSSLKELYDYGV